MSRPVSVLGDLVLTGHLCSLVAPITIGEPTVFTIGRPTSVLGTPLAPHTIKIGKKCKPHVAVTYGASTVFAQGRPVNKIGDPADLGVIITGNSRVFCI